MTIEDLARAIYRRRRQITGLGQHWEGEPEQLRRRYRDQAAATVLDLADDDERIMDAAGWAESYHGDPDLRAAISRRRSLIAEARGTSPDHHRLTAPNGREGSS
jgi:hypothetical protein